MSQSLCICVTITNNPITIIPSQQVLPPSYNTKYKITVSVCIGCCRLSITQSSRSAASGESIARQRAETPEMQTGDKKEEKILFFFFPGMCMWSESKMGMSRLPVFVFLLQNNAEYFYIAMVAFTPTFTLWSPVIWRRVVWLVDMKVTEKHELMSLSPGSSFFFRSWRHCLAPTTLVSSYQTTRFHNLENLMSCTLYTQSWWLNFALVSCTWNNPHFARNKLIVNDYLKTTCPKRVLASH